MSEDVCTQCTSLKRSMRRGGRSDQGHSVVARSKRGTSGGREERIERNVAWTVPGTISHHDDI